MKICLNFHTCILFAFVAEKEASIISGNINSPPFSDQDQVFDSFVENLTSTSTATPEFSFTNNTIPVLPVKDYSSETPPLSKISSNPIITASSQTSPIFEVKETPPVSIATTSYLNILLGK